MRAQRLRAGGGAGARGAVEQVVAVVGLRSGNERAVECIFEALAHALAFVELDELGVVAARIGHQQLSFDVVLPGLEAVERVDGALDGLVVACQLDGRGVLARQRLGRHARRHQARTGKAVHHRLPPAHRPLRFSAQHHSHCALSVTHSA